MAGAYGPERLGVISISNGLIWLFQKMKTKAKQIISTYEGGRGNEKPQKQDKGARGALRAQPCRTQDECKKCTYLVIPGVNSIFCGSLDFGLISNFAKILDIESSMDDSAN